MESFSPQELELLEILWREGPMKPAEIQKRLSRPVQNSALRWQLKTLVEKGRVTRRRKGKAFYYRSRVPRESVFAGVTRRLADLFSGGSVVALAGRILESQDGLSPEDVRELRRIAERYPSSPSPAGKRKGEQDEC